MVHTDSVMTIESVKYNLSHSPFEGIIDSIKWSHVHHKLWIIFKPFQQVCSNFVPGYRIQIHVYLKAEPVKPQEG